MRDLDLSAQQVSASLAEIRHRHLGDFVQLTDNCSHHHVRPDEAALRQEKRHRSLIDSLNSGLVAQSLVMMAKQRWPEQQLLSQS